MIKNSCKKLWKSAGEFFNKDLEHCLYWISIFMVIFFAIMMALVIYFDSVNNPEQKVTCTMKILFGIPCPGCGGTRAIIALFKGRILTSIYYHAAVPYTAIVYGVFFVSQTLQRLTKGKIKGVKFHYWYLWGVIGIIIVQFIMKLFIPGYSV